MRAIVRYSVEGEQDEQLNNRLREVLQKAGFVPNLHVAATYEHNAISGPQLAQAMLDFWDQASHSPWHAHLEHVWMYSDNPPDFPLPDFGLGDET